MLPVMAWISILATILFTLLLRMPAVLPGIFRRKPSRKLRGEPTYLLVVLGSGGHTAEMLQLIRNLDPASYTFRRYVVSSGDSFSAEKAKEFEKGLGLETSSQKNACGSFDIRYVSRARKVHQSLLSTPFSAGACFWDCLRLLCERPRWFKEHEIIHERFPDIVLTNGPATATIMIFASIFLRLIGSPGSSEMMRCIYVESWARVKRLSLSGRILKGLRLCDRILVQWRSLEGAGTEFRGQLIA